MIIPSLGGVRPGCRVSGYHPFSPGGGEAFRCLGFILFTVAWIASDWRVEPALFSSPCGRDIETFSSGFLDIAADESA